VPKAVMAWRDRLEHLHRLDKWAVDARFYCLGTHTLSAWRDKATKHHNQRLRDAYRQLRAQVKIRLAGTCFSLWRERTARLASMQFQGNEFTQARTQSVASSALRAMQTRVSHRQNLNAQAEALDQTKLLSSALSALLISHANQYEMSAQAVLFRQESDTVLLVNTWKKLQWRAFTTARQRETADAFRTRTREQRLRSMLRFWAGKSAIRRAKRSFEAQREFTTESPSLRPASRRAAASSQSHFGKVASAAEELPSFLEIGPSPFEEDPNRTFLNTTTTTLPAYLRTPSRSSRRSTRFHSQYQNLHQRPILPTPAHATPLVFDPGAFLATSTPAYPPPATSLAMPVRSKEKHLDDVDVGPTSKNPAPATTTTSKASTTTTSPRAAQRVNYNTTQTSTPLRQQQSGRRSTTPTTGTSTPQITPFSRKLRAGGVSMPSLSIRPKLSTTLGRSATSPSAATTGGKVSVSSPAKSNGIRENTNPVGPINGGPTAAAANHSEAPTGQTSNVKGGPNEDQGSPLIVGDSPCDQEVSGEGDVNSQAPLGRSILGTGKSVRFASPTSASLAKARKSRFG
jgi:protein SFI1